MRYGGHSKAVGLTVARSRLNEFRQTLLEKAENMIRKEDLQPHLPIEAELKAVEANVELIKELSLLEPFGHDNPNPVFMMKKAVIKNRTRVGAEGNHLRLVLENGHSALSCIGWGMGDLANRLEEGSRVDLAFHLESNVWKGRSYPQLVLEDIRC